MKIKVAKELFVGIRNDAVGWAVAYNATTKKGKENQDKVKRWAGKGCLTKIVLNEPTEGFEIDKSVSRYSTSNKLWRIKDPRGFILEISTENMEMLLENCTMEKGVVKDKCVWGVSGKMVLVPEGHPEFNNLLKEQTVKTNYLSPSKLKPGMILRKNTGEKIQYLGKAYRYGIIKQTRTTNVKTRWGTWEWEWYISSVEDTPNSVHVYKNIGNKRIYFQKTLKASLIEDNAVFELTQEYIDENWKNNKLICNGNFHTYDYVLRMNKTSLRHDEENIFDEKGSVIYNCNKRRA